MPYWRFLYKIEIWPYQELKPIPYQPLLSVQEGMRMAQIFKQEGRHYLFVSGGLTKLNDLTILYARDISNIYEQRLQSVYLSILIASTNPIVGFSILYVFTMDNQAH